jgi:hypothetical protein
MATPPTEPSLSKEQRDALVLLASIPYGVTEDMLVLGFDRPVIAGLINAGLVEARSEIVTGPSRTKIEVVRIKISDAGRRALED